MKVEIYSDIACPWCYIGKKRFERALASFPDKDRVEVVYRPFQLDPNLPSDPSQAIPSPQYLQARFGPGFRQKVEPVVQLAAAEGIDFNFDQVLEINTMDAHRLLWLAAEEGEAVQVRVKEGLFKAHFSDGLNIGDRDVLVKVATEAGLEADKVRAYLESDAGRDEVKTATRQGQEMGISGVPTFVFEGQWSVSGAQESDTFLKVLTQVAQNLQSEKGAE
jgi:predicted DsbA family dithiol-disulfide isomerase